MSENALLQERALAIFQNWPGRPGHDKHDSDGFFRTLRVGLPFAFSDENTRRLCLKLRQTFEVAAAKLLDQSIVLSLVKLVFRVRASVY